MRILGAYGYSTEYPLARYYRDVPTYTMVEGSANICKAIIAGDQLAIARPTANPVSVQRRHLLAPGGVLASCRSSA